MTRACRPLRFSVSSNENFHHHLDNTPLDCLPLRKIIQLTDFTPFTFLGPLEPPFGSTFVMAAKAAAAGGMPKSRRSRKKSRTEVFSSSSSSEVSSSESESETEEQKRKIQKTASSSKASAGKSSKKSKPLKADDASSSSSSDSDSAPSSSPAPVGGPSHPAAAAAFPSWYLRTVTTELAEDLDKVRNAADFRDSALPLLVHALQQGEGVFSTAEKTKIMSAGNA